MANKYDDLIDGLIGNATDPTKLIPKSILQDPDIQDMITDLDILSNEELEDLLRKLMTKHGRPGNPDNQIKATDIIQDALHRFVTDEDIKSWNLLIKHIGDLSKLKTIDKTTIVGAINEIHDMVKYLIDNGINDGNGGFTIQEVIEARQDVKGEFHNSLSERLAEDYKTVRERLEIAENKVSDAENEAFVIKSNQWKYNEVTKMYEYIITHYLNSTHLLINAYKTLTLDWVFVSARILDSHNVLMQSDNIESLTVIINARYHTSDLSTILPDNYYTKEETYNREEIMLIVQGTGNTNKEVEAARVDIKGTIQQSLKDRLQSDYNSISSEIFVINDSIMNIKGMIGDVRILPNKEIVKDILAFNTVFNAVHAIATEAKNDTAALTSAYNTLREDVDRILTANGTIDMSEIIDARIAISDGIAKASLGQRLTVDFNAHNVRINSVTNEVQLARQDVTGYTHHTLSQRITSDVNRVLDEITRIDSDILTIKSDMTIVEENIMTLLEGIRDIGTEFSYITTQVNIMEKNVDTLTVRVRKLENDSGPDLSKYYTKEETYKRSEIEDRLDEVKFVHPDTHSLSMITETDDLKIMTNNERVKLASLKNQDIPDTYTADKIIETDDRKFMTPLEKEYTRDVLDARTNSSDVYSRSLKERLDLDYSTLKGLIDSCASAINDVYTKKEVDDLIAAGGGGGGSSVDITEIVNARTGYDNHVHPNLSARLGKDFSDIWTSLSSLVNDINSAKVDSDSNTHGTVANRLNTEFNKIYTSLTSHNTRITNAVNSIGSLNILGTNNKTNIVNAINEVISRLNAINGITIKSEVNPFSLDTVKRSGSSIVSDNNGIGVIVQAGGATFSCILHIPVSNIQNEITYALKLNAQSASAKLYAPSLRLNDGKSIDLISIADDGALYSFSIVANNIVPGGDAGLPYVPITLTLSSASADNISQLYLYNAKVFTYSGKLHDIYLGLVDGKKQIHTALANIGTTADLSFPAVSLAKAIDAVNNKVVAVPTNHYKKSETYNKTEIDYMIANGGGGSGEGGGGVFDPTLEPRITYLEDNLMNKNPIIFSGASKIAIYVRNLEEKQMFVDFSNIHIVDEDGYEITYSDIIDSHVIITDKKVIPNARRYPQLKVMPNMSLSAYDITGTMLDEYESIVVILELNKVYNLNIVSFSALSRYGRVEFGLYSCNNLTIQASLTHYYNWLNGILAIMTNDKYNEVDGSETVITFASDSPHVWEDVMVARSGYKTINERIYMEIQGLLKALDKPANLSEVHEARIDVYGTEHASLKDRLSFDFNSIFSITIINESAIRHLTARVTELENTSGSAGLGRIEAVENEIYAARGAYDSLSERFDGINLAPYNTHINNADIHLSSYDKTKWNDTTSEVNAAKGSYSSLDERFNNITVDLSPVEAVLEDHEDRISDLEDSALEVKDNFFYIIDKASWTLNNATGNYEYNLTHSLNSTNVLMNAISLETNAICFIGGTVINDSNILIETFNPETIKVIISAKYVAPILTGTYDNEIIDARGSYPTLKDRLDSLSENAGLTQRVEELEKELHDSRDAFSFLKDRLAAMEARIKTLEGYHQGQPPTGEGTFKDGIIYDVVEGNATPNRKFNYKIISREE